MVKCSCGFRSKHEFAFCPDCGNRYVSKNDAASKDETNSTTELTPGRSLRIPAVISLALVLAVIWQLTVGSTTTVPNVLGLHSETARTRLQAAHLIAIETSAASNTMPKGYVTSVAPSAGQKLKRNESVQITISTGNDLVEVPELKNLSLESAIDILSGLELVLVIDSEVYRSKPQGVVAKSLVKVGTILKKGSQVHVLISKGPRPVDPVQGGWLKDPPPFPLGCGNYIC